MDLDAYSVSKEPMDGIVKSPTIWGHKGNSVFPIAYLRKPKHISAGEWKEVVNSIRIKMKRR